MTSEFDIEKRRERIAALKAELAAAEEDAEREDQEMFATQCTVPVASIVLPRAEQKTHATTSVEYFVEMANRFIVWARAEGAQPNRPINQMDRSATASTLSLWKVASSVTTWSLGYSSSGGGRDFDDVWVGSTPTAIEASRRMDYYIGCDNASALVGAGIYVHEYGSEIDSRAPKSLLKRAYATGVFYDQERLLAGGSDVDALFEVVNFRKIFDKVSELADFGDFDRRKF